MQNKTQGVCLMSDRDERDDGIHRCPICRQEPADNVFRECVLCKEAVCANCIVSSKQIVVCKTCVDSEYYADYLEAYCSELEWKLFQKRVKQ